MLYYECIKFLKVGGKIFQSCYNNKIHKLISRGHMKHCMGCIRKITYEKIQYNFKEGY